MQRSRSSATLATPLDFIFLFIMPVIMPSIPGIAVPRVGNYLSIPMGIGIPGLPSGDILRFMFFFRRLRP